MLMVVFPELGSRTHDASMESLEQPLSQEASAKSRSPEPMQQDDDSSTIDKTIPESKSGETGAKVCETAVHREDSNASLCSSSDIRKQPSCEKLERPAKNGVVRRRPMAKAHTPLKPKLCLYSYIIHGGNAATL